MTASLLPPHKITLADELRAAIRELHMRQSVYPRWVAGNKMKQSTADHEIACMSAIVERLEAIRDRGK